MSDWENRLVELEIRVVLQDELLQSLNDTIVQMRETLDLQQGQLRFLYQKMQQLQNHSQDKPYSLTEEIPPHY